VESRGEEVNDGVDRWNGRVWNCEFLKVNSLHRSTNYRIRGPLIIVCCGRSRLHRIVVDIRPNIIDVEVSSWRRTENQETCYLKWKEADV
jgi:hypothetical protein